MIPRVPAQILPYFYGLPLLHLLIPLLNKVTIRIIIYFPKGFYCDFQIT